MKAIRDIHRSGIFSFVFSFFNLFWVYGLGFIKHLALLSEFIPVLKISPPS